MVVPVRHQTAQQIRTAEERRIAGRRATENKVIATAGAGMATIDHEFFGRQACVMGRIVKVRRLLDQLIPAMRRMDIHLDHTRIGRDGEFVQARIFGRRTPNARSGRFGTRLIPHHFAVPTTSRK